jgi:Zn-dependent protease with chaperone function/Zn-finger nucleic acid-binding protein
LKKWLFCLYAIGSHDEGETTKNDTREELMTRNFAPDFFDLQKEQWRKSLFLLSVLIIFYFLLIGMFLLVAVQMVHFFLEGSFSLSSSSLAKILVADAALAVGIAVFHLYDARKNGAGVIRKRLRASPPEKEDRYHRTFINSTEEMRIACGLPKTEPLVIPSFAINSMAIIESDGTPDILVTEGLLAEFTREDLQAVIAHEIAHIDRGDSFYLTLVCSLANLFERARQALEVEDDTAEAFSQGGGTRAAFPLADLALKLSSVIMHLLSTLISRQREILADAAAVEICRNPRALARAISKAHLKNSFVGDFHLTYSPLFIVSPESRDISDGFFSRLFNSHPPLLKRIKILAGMASTTSADIFHEVRQKARFRKKYRLLRKAWSERGGSAAAIPSSSRGLDETDDRFWKIRHPNGVWKGPLSIEELLSDRFFTPLIQIENLQEHIRASAKEFPQIRLAIKELYKQRPVNPARQNRCPDCGTLLKEQDYEGVPVKECPRCGGVLVRSSLVDRILARKEIGFSPGLKEKAEAFREQFLQNPLGYARLKQEKEKIFFCPVCTGKMMSRPFNYSYVVPVEKCLSCGHIWFDADEIEILQILIEDR